MVPGEQRVRVGIWHWLFDWLGLKVLMAMFPFIKGTQNVNGRVTKKLLNAQF